MKEPTTEYQIAMSQRVDCINHEWLISNGFELNDETPLINRYQHTKNRLLFVTIGLYGELFIGEKHWCNDDCERVFATINPEITPAIFQELLKHLNIHI